MHQTICWSVLFDSLPKATDEAVLYGVVQGHTPSRLISEQIHLENGRRENGVAMVRGK